jgi:hypothetical protein
MKTPQISFSFRVLVASVRHSFASTFSVALPLVVLSRNRTSRKRERKAEEEGKESTQQYNEEEARLVFFLSREAQQKTGNTHPKKENSCFVFFTVTSHFFFLIHISSLAAQLPVVVHKKYIYEAE